MTGPLSDTVHEAIYAELEAAVEAGELDESQEGHHDEEEAA